eukprot:1253575-Ditylum_brightwellii.AAC.1
MQSRLTNSIQENVNNGIKQKGAAVFNQTVPGGTYFTNPVTPTQTMLVPGDPLTPATPTHHRASAVPITLHLATIVLIKAPLLALPHHESLWDRSGRDMLGNGHFCGLV